MPDHSTIAEFGRRHEHALAGVFSQVLALCREAGLVSVGVIAVDGMKIAANASKERNLEYERLVTEILAETERTDQEEDRQLGDSRGDELPGGDERGERMNQGSELVLRFDREVIQRASGRGRRRWFVEAQKQLDEQRSGSASRSPARALSGWWRPSGGCANSSTPNCRPTARPGRFPGRRAPSPRIS